MRLRLMTWNIHIGIGLDGQLNLERVAAEIAAQNPDLVALQEVDAYRPRTGTAVQWRELGRLTGLAAFFGPNVTSPQDGQPDAGRLPARWVQQYGNAVLTRLPVSGVELHLLTYRSEGEGYKEQRGCLEVETPPVTVLATHWGLVQEERMGQMQDLVRLAERAEAAGRPAVILGDLNSLSVSPEIMPLRARMRDAGAGAGPTFPAGGPERRIDYCFLPKAWSVIAAQVLPTAASDHRALVVDVETGA